MTVVFTAAGVTVAVYMSCIFLVAIALKDNSVVDIAYGGAFIAAVAAAGLVSWTGHPRQLLVTGMITLWGLRLAVHLFTRSRGRGEDFRYRKWREEWGSYFLIRSFFQIYLLQGTVVLIVASPALMVMASPGPGLGLLDAAGVGIWTLGFIFEALGDWQLLVFKKDSGNRGKIITHGLWRYSRHPNYFGECTLWWGVYLVALGSPGALWTAVSPLTINFLLLYVSGIPMLEKKYKGDPAFEEYKRRTSPLIPWFPRA
jgi:steroid 5-alpha reductase family enzyme